MFTGIVTAIGEIVKADTHSGGARWQVLSPYEASMIEVGASICHSGVCLTVTSVEPKDRGSLYSVDLVKETLDRSIHGAVKSGDTVNLEMSLKLGDELGGHLVFGHIDGVGEIKSLSENGDGKRIWILAPKSLAPYLAVKGSVAVNGVSLTVNGVEDGEYKGRDGVSYPCRFALDIIPHTLEVTTLGALRSGDKVNLEADMLARYAARYSDYSGRTGS